MNGQLGSETPALLNFRVQKIPRKRKSEPKGERSEDLKVFEHLFGASLQSLRIIRFTEPNQRIAV